MEAPPVNATSGRAASQTAHSSKSSGKAPKSASIGAVGAAIVSPFAGIYVQLLVFALITLISIFTVRPFALRYLYKGGKNVRPSNADALIGQMGTVSETIQAGGFGRVDIGGDNWKAVGRSEEDIPQGTRVRVVGRESIIITVEKTN